MPFPFLSEGSIKSPVSKHCNFLEIIRVQVICFCGLEILSDLGNNRKLTVVSVQSFEQLLSFLIFSYK